MVSDMFFRREKPHVPTFQERVDTLKKYKFDVQSEAGGRVRATRDGIGVLISDGGANLAKIDREGLVIGSEIGELVNGGYQQFWLTPSHKRVPATAEQLKAMHEFEEDLREALGLDSLFNTSLGTVSAMHLYDRVQQRDVQPEPKPWQVRLNRG